jgi:hypothetical protein
MSVRPRQLAILFACALLSGCGTINERMSASMADYVPQWAGGLPADAPPRPGSPKYDEFKRERERQRLIPADQREQKPAKPDPSGLDPVH